MMYLFQGQVFLKQLSGNHHLEQSLIWVKRLAIHAKIVKVDNRSFKTIVLVWLHDQFAVSVIFDKTGVLQHLGHFLVIMFTRV